MQKITNKKVLKKDIFSAAKYIFLFILSLLLILSITFVLFEKMPGKVYDDDYIKNSNVIINLQRKYGLNEPIHKKYFKLLKNTSKLDFGHSYVSGLSVNKVISQKFSISLKLGLVALLISVVLGIYIATKISNNEKTKKNNILKLVILDSIPTFVMAIILQYIFCVKLKVFPMYGYRLIIDYFLPILVLCIAPTIAISRIISNEMYKIKQSTYIKTMKVNGVSNFYINKIIIINSLPVLLSFIGITIANIIVGSFTVETIFNIPGLGRYFITSITNRDYNMVMGLTIFYSFIMLLFIYSFEYISTVINYKGDIYGKND